VDARAQVHILSSRSIY